MKKLRGLDCPPQPTLKCTAIQIWILLSGLLVSLAVAEQAATDQAKKLDSARKARKEKLTLFQQKYQLSRVSIDTILIVPISISGKLAKGLKKTDPVEAAYEFFDLNKEIYGLKEPKVELKVNGWHKDDIGTLVVFKQLYNGIEVWNSMIKVNFGRDGSLHNISGSPYQDIDISTTASIDSNMAVRVAKQDLPPQSKNVRVISSTLRIFPHQDKYYITWLVKVSVDSPPGAWEYFIDASTGQILYKMNRMKWLNSVDNLNRATFAQVKRYIPQPSDTARPILPDSSLELIPIPVESGGVAVDPKKPAVYDTNVIIVPPLGSPEWLKIRPIIRGPGRKLPVDSSEPTLIPAPSVPSDKPASPSKAPGRSTAKKSKKPVPDSGKINSAPKSNSPEVLPDLYRYTPNGWSGPIVVSGVQNTNVHSAVVVGEIAYIDLAGQNQGVRLYFLKLPK